MLGSGDKIRLIKGLYAIIDNSLCPHISNQKLAEMVLKGGAKILQLRGKGLSSKELLSQASDINSMAKEAGAVFIVNDRADIALLSGADGVHLGQDDLPLLEARKIMGSDGLIGVSTHNLEQALRAQTEGADYIGFGPVYPTVTKADAEEAKGLVVLRSIKAEVSIPVIAIGGITDENIGDIFSSAADGAAVISAISKAANVEAAVGILVASINKKV